MSPYRTAPAQGSIRAGDLVKVVAPKPGHLWMLGKVFAVARVIDEALVIADGILWCDEIAPAARRVA